MQGYVLIYDADLFLSSLAFQSYKEYIFSFPKSFKLIHYYFRQM